MDRGYLVIGGLQLALGIGWMVLVWLLLGLW
jgi:hypothetical protein